ncbi:MAG TPA: glutamyl-tRNA reductase [Chitinophagaceae bacterium]|nr:glutamyl-tRNA reductase [Chitinophagaceae bacterium]
MAVRITKDISHFFVAGINYRKSDSGTRGLFAVNQEQYGAILELARSRGLDELFLLSTCNRTEIYGFAENPEQLIDLVCSQTNGGVSLFQQKAYIFAGEKAINHLYSVSAGLDSQILGDYEVVSQVRQAARFARDRGFLGSFTERVVSSVLQVSKVIKNQTSLSAGTVSVAFAAVQLLEKVPGIQTKNILLVGTGKTGRNACKNMMDRLGITRITLVNRTDEKAREFAEQFQLHIAAYSDLENQVRDADIILVATHSQTPTVRLDWLRHSGSKIILDLSIPHNVEDGVRSLPHIKLIDLDELSRIQDETLSQRQGEVPKATALIEENMREFLYWYQMRKHAVVLQAVKQKLQEIHASEISHPKPQNSSRLEDFHEVSSRIIQKTINLLASKVRKEHPRSEQYLELIGELFETGPKS